MKYLLIGVGGTGARVLEAFTYLSAAGVLGEEVSEVHMRMVDMDTENGNLRRLLKVLDAYNRSYKHLYRHIGEWNARKIIYPSNAPFTWQVGINEAKTLKDKFLQDNENEHLLYGLYGNEELNLDLTVGSKGRPRIGSLEFSKRFIEDLTMGPSSFWEKLFEGDLRTAATNGELRVMLVGSIFGGSGASGVPNLAKLIKDTYCGGNNAVGITLMAPFYNFSDVAVEVNEGAKSKEFMINSKAALLYYAQSNILKKLHSLYLVGGKVRPMRSIDNELAATSVGSTEQCNPAMPELLVAALSILDFFVNASEENAGQQVIADTETTSINDWRSYPYAEVLETGMNRLQRLALMWRLIEKVSHNNVAWRALHKNYRKMLGGNELFDTKRFLEYTSDLREFLAGQEDGDHPLNVGVEGYLKELEINGLGHAIDIEKETQLLDAAVGLDRPERMAELCSGISISELVNNLQYSKEIAIQGIIDDAEKRRATFIAAATKACL